MDKEDIYSVFRTLKNREPSLTPLSFMNDIYFVVPFIFLKRNVSYPIETWRTVNTFKTPQGFCDFVVFTMRCFAMSLTLLCVLVFFFFHSFLAL